MLLIAAPAWADSLTVRLLEKRHPKQLEIRANALRCEPNGTVRHGATTLRVDGPHVRMDAACSRVTATGPIRIAGRDYTGALVVEAREGELALILETDLEDYIAGVISAELGPAPAAALEAQAIVSRTYALAMRRRHGAHDLCDLAHCQRFDGAPTPAARAAANRTRGQVLLDSSGALAPTFFHASCGGATSGSRAIFDEGASTGVADSCGPDTEWRWTAPAAQLARAIGGPETGTLEKLIHDASGRVVQLRAFGVELGGADFHARVGRAFGYHKLPSMKLKVRQEPGAFHFLGRGLGHGVGLCQRGALALARQGRSAREILRHYFPRTQASNFAPTSPDNRVRGPERAKSAP